MKRAQFVMALWGVTGLAAGLQAGDCDCPKSSCKQCVCLDDSGALDHIDKVASQFHASFKKNFRLISKLGTTSSCEAGPTCGCEIKPTCGCEIKPSCGCEIKPSCGCETKDSEPSCGCELNATSSPVPTESNSAPPQTTYNVRPSQSRENSPPNMLAPKPVPDSQQDPFADEPRSSQSKVRGRTIQYRSNGQPQNSPSQLQPRNLQSMPNSQQRPTYGQQYNTQARNTATAGQHLGEHQPTQRPLQLVAPASSESPTIEQVFKSAYRKNLSDSQVTTNQTSQAVQGLRPVPSKNVEAGLSNTSSRNSTRPIVPTEPIRDLNDPYERDESTAVGTQDNPLRR